MVPVNNKKSWLVLSIAVVSTFFNNNLLFLPTALANLTSEPSDYTVCLFCGDSNSRKTSPETFPNNTLIDGSSDDVEGSSHGPSPPLSTSTSTYGDISFSDELNDGGNNHGPTNNIFKADGANEQLDDNGRWSGVDLLVGIFFCVAAVWLIMASIYSIILLVLLRLQARGELDIYDENLGRLVLCNGRITLRFGFILRRYAIQLEHDYRRRVHRQQQQQQQQNLGGENIGPLEEPARVPVRIMTREERRKAIEEVLGIEQKSVTSWSADTRVSWGEGPKRNSCGCLGNAANELEASETSVAEYDDDDDEQIVAESVPQPETSFDAAEEGPVCSICLAEYEPEDVLFSSKTCPHRFHKDCLMGWLERRNNTECPCCREPMVSDDDVWSAVQRLRKERRKQLRAENGWTHRWIRAMLIDRRGREVHTQQNSGIHLNNENVGSLPSTEDEDPESQQDTDEETYEASSEILESADHNASGNDGPIADLQLRDVDVSTSPSDAPMDDSQDLERAYS